MADIPIRSLKDMADEVRARCPDPVPHANPLVDLWRRELDGQAKGAIRSMATYDEEMAARVAAEAIARGCTPSVIASALDEAHEICTTSDQPK